MTTTSVRIPTPKKYLLLCLVALIPTAILAAFSVIYYNSSESELSNIGYEVFWVGEETNVPTFVNFFLLAIAGVFMLPIADQAFRQGTVWRWHWLAFAALMIVMAFDESAQLHEPVGDYFTQGIQGRGFIQWTWVLAGAAVVLVLGILGFNFVRSMRRPTKTFVLCAVFIYLGGALGLEMVAAYLNYNMMENARIVTLGEELFEMTGAALFGAAALAEMHLETDARVL